MEQFKRVKVIILPTENTINVLKGYTDKSLLSKYRSEYKSIPPEVKYVSYFHLYIISDDEIKSGDYVINEKNELVLADLWKNREGKKVIATTNWNETNLPQPSQQFIEKYVEEYNKGNIITDILVEYEVYMQRQSNIGTTKYIVSKDNKSFTKLNFDRVPTLLGVKTNPKDNTITIKKLKDSWNREEIIELLNKLTDDWNNYNKVIVLNEWIEENL